MTRGATIEVGCAWCKKQFSARVADRNRGWAKFCSKKCKAAEQENRTGQYRSWASRQCAKLDGNSDRKHAYVFDKHVVFTVIEDDEEDFDPSWDAHKNDF